MVGIVISTPLRQFQYLQVRNWDKWQSYRRDRGHPPWIKVHRRLMRDSSWVALTDAQKGQLIAIWMLAADQNGRVPSSPTLIKKLCCLEHEPDLTMLMSLGFLDAKMTPRRRKHVALETETETETETEEKVRESASPSAQPEVFHEKQKERGKSMKGARLSEGWLPSSEDHLYAVGLLGEEGVARQLDDFRDYWMAKSGAGATKVDWGRTWRTWCRKAKDWKGNGNGSGRPRPLQDDSLSASRAAGRLIEAAKRGEFSFAPRPSLYPTKSPDDLLLLPKGRDTGS